MLNRAMSAGSEHH